MADPTVVDAGVVFEVGVLVDVGVVLVDEAF
jgi:hypothetical protein